VLRSGLAEQHEMHTLADELGAIDEHIELYRSLFGSLSYDRQIADHGWRVMVPTRILVPLVENALTHGKPDGLGYRSVKVAAEFAGDGFRISVYNPWAGCDVSSSGLGSGIEHVKQRLALVFGDRAAVAIEIRNGMFHVMMDLPLV
jgi:two-component system sensor histidine kinase AlgZ